MDTHWHAPKPHAVQDALVKDNIRFKLVPAGRRSGKTFRAKRYVVQKAMQVVGNYFVAAPTRDQVKKIYWEDIKNLSLYNVIPGVYVRESDLTVQFENGSKIFLIGLDQPKRIEGIYWKGGIIDEIADVKHGAWELNIKPALDTLNPLDPTYRSWCWLIGVPEGRNHYYDLVQYALHGKNGVKDPDWAVYTWVSSDILPPDVIESAKRTMSKTQFKQEYEASFELGSGLIYAGFGVHNYTTETIKPTEQLIWFHDFNYTPRSSGIAVQRVENGKTNIYCLEEIVLIGGTTSTHAAIEFVEKYREHRNKNVILYGDPAGRAGEKHSLQSEYTELENILRANGWKVERRVKPKAPSIKDRQNAVRAKICSYNDEVSLFVNPSKCEYLDKGLRTLTFKEGSGYLEEETDYQHITTALGYYIDFEYPIRRDGVGQVDVYIPQATSLFRGN
jgi:hypothetical protein